MRLLCDANLGSRIANALTAAGFDVVRSIHVLGQAASDEEVLALAVSDERILLTCDSDFGELVFGLGKKSPTATVYVRFEPQEVNEIIPRLLAVLELPNIAGHMVVIGNAGDRMTALPI